MTLTVFSWGYDGWGNATSELKQAVDAVERSRGFKSPFFVDIRIQRSARAKGFTGTNFESTLVMTAMFGWMTSGIGRSRHRKGE
jgi:hypothetical protein